MASSGAHVRLGHPMPSSGWARGIVIGGVIVAACVASFAVAVANSRYFDLVNGAIGLREEFPRALLFSSFLLLIGGAVVIRSPAHYGFQLGAIRQEWRPVLLVTLAAMATTAALLAMIGPIPYSDASVVVEVVVVPFTEELVFRAVLLTIMLGVFASLAPAPRAVVLAVGANGLAFGLAHLANAQTLASTFVIGQAAFATVLGVCCAALMVRTRSVYPAMLLHGAVNAVVVLV